MISSRRNGSPGPPTAFRQENGNTSRISIAFATAAAARSAAERSFSSRKSYRRNADPVPPHWLEARDLRALSRRRASLRSTAAEETYLPDFLAVRDEANPRAMNACWAWRNSTLRLTASSMKLDSVSPERRTSSAASRNSGGTRTAGMAADLMENLLHRICNAMMREAQCVGKRACALVPRRAAGDHSMNRSARTMISSRSLEPGAFAPRAQGFETRVSLLVMNSSSAGRPS